MRGLFLAFLLLPALVASAWGAGSLRYSGEDTLYRDTVWEGEVLIDGILTVAPGATLEIRPGTMVRFTRADTNKDGIGEHEMFIQGTFRALGTAQAPIVFTSAEANPVPGDWGAINMMASDGDNRLENCLVEYAYRGFHAHFARARLSDSVFRRNVRGIQFQESTVSIDACRIIENLNGVQFRDSTVTFAGSVLNGNYWGLRCVYSEVTLSGCRIEDNLVNGANLRDSVVEVIGNLVGENRKGLYLQRSRGVVRGNSLTNNIEYGILLEDSVFDVLENRIAGNNRGGIKWTDSQGTLKGNLLTENGEYALVNDGAGDVDASQNWWGTPLPEEVEELVRDGRKRPDAGLAFTVPLLKEKPLFRTHPLPELNNRKR